ncbi:MAG: Rrf2 family transcriptional regulator [Candidatus Melainabacteria bacterium]|nr:Rrf2 family transcriptional regulator [Candidatus Melainabacteria bacterium]
MKITAQEEYGLRCLLQVAQITSKDELASLEDIARAEHITSDYAAKLLTVLRRKDLVASVRGKSGGYKLLRPPEQIYLDEVIRSLSGELFETESCQQFPGNDSKCVHISCCSIRSVWISVSQVLFNIFKQITLKDLLEKEDLLSKYLKKQLVLSF